MCVCAPHVWNKLTQNRPDVFIVPNLIFVQGSRIIWPVQVVTLFGCIKGLIQHELCLIVQQGNGFTVG